MPDLTPESYTAFVGHSRIASGALADVALAAKRVMDRGEDALLLVFNDASSARLELDLRGIQKDVLARLAQRFPQAVEPEAALVPEFMPAPERKAGRPKLGVVGREVTLLPRHWAWLAEQPGGASVALRKLVDDARKSNLFSDLSRRVKDVTYRFIYVMAGNFPHFEDAMRALFADDRDAFMRLTENWPADVRDHARWLMAGGVLSGETKA